MSKTATRSSSRKGATCSRRGRSGRRSQRRPVAGWRRPLRHTRRTLDASLELIACSQQIADASERAGATRPVHTTRELQKASNWLQEAADHLGRAARALSQTRSEAALAPETAGALPARLLEVTVLWIDTAALLLAANNRVDDTFTRLLDSIASGTAVFPDPSLYRRPVANLPRIPMGRGLVPRWPSCEHIPVITIHVRRRRSVVRAACEPPRRISRGRAPPLSRVPSHTTRVRERKGEFPWLKIQSQLPLTRISSKR